MTGVWVLLGALVAAGAVGLWLRAVNGRVRGSASPRALPEPVAQAVDRDAAVTLVQLSTTFCSSCRRTRSLLEDVADRTTGLAYAELDVTDQPAVAGSLGVRRAPTTLAIGRDGTNCSGSAGFPGGTNCSAHCARTCRRHCSIQWTHLPGAGSTG